MIGISAAVKQAVKESMEWMDKTLKFTKEIRLAVESQEHSVRKLVRYNGYGIVRLYNCV